MNLTINATAAASDNSCLAAASWDCSLYLDFIYARFYLVDVMAHTKSVCSCTRHCQPINRVGAA